MPHHLADTFYRHAVVQANQGCEGVTALIVGKMAVQATLFGNHFQAAVEVSSDWHIKQFAVLAFSAIFLNDAQGYVQQFDMSLRLGLLTCDVNPLATVLLRDDVVLRQIR